MTDKDDELNRIAAPPSVPDEPDDKTSSEEKQFAEARRPTPTIRLEEHLCDQLTDWKSRHDKLNGDTKQELKTLADINRRLERELKDLSKVAAAQHKSIVHQRGVSWLTATLTALGGIGMSAGNNWFVVGAALMIASVASVIVASIADCWGWPKCLNRALNYPSRDDDGESRQSS